MNRLASAVSHAAPFDPTSKLGRLLRAFRRHGPVGFARLCLYNLKLLWTGEFREGESIYDDAFDRAYGVSTLGRVDLDEIEAPETCKAGMVRYEAIQPGQFEHLLHRAGAGSPVKYTFVDIGSGKGRALILAAAAGFRRVIGVEFGLNLHRDAVANVERLRAGGHDWPIELVNGDATAYDFPPEPTVCLLNNPFEEPLVSRFLDNLERSLHVRPRDFRLVYFHCNHADVIRARTDWREYAAGVCENHHHAYAIFRWLGAAQD